MIHYYGPYNINGFGSLIVSAIIHISEIANELHEESPTYSTTNLLSDLGGALGLCLGLSIWTILKAMCKCKIIYPYKTKMLSANPSPSSGEIEISEVNDFLIGYYMGYKQLLKIFPILSTKSQPFIPKDVPKKEKFIISDDLPRC